MRFIYKNPICLYNIYDACFRGGLKIGYKLQRYREAYS